MALRKYHHLYEIPIPLFRYNGAPAGKGGGYIYIINLGGLYKIGRSHSPLGRLVIHQKDIPIKITEAHFIPADNQCDAELVLLHRFKGQRVNIGKRREFFSLTDDQYRELKSYKSYEAGEFRTIEPTTGYYIYDWSK